MNCLACGTGPVRVLDSGTTSETVSSDAGHLIEITRTIERVSECDGCHTRRLESVTTVRRDLGPTPKRYVAGAIKYR